MARVVGQSGAWSAIASDIARCGHAVSAPGDLPALFDTLTNSRPTSIEKHRQKTHAAVQERTTQIAQLRAQRGLFRALLNAVRIRAIKSQIAAAYALDAAYASSLDQAIVRVGSHLGSPEFAGAQAEFAVIGRLRQLPDRFLVFNDVQLRANRRIQFDGIGLQSAQIDHVVLSKCGVFAIETKYWSRKFIESGKFHDPFDQSRRAGYLLYDLLRQSFGKTRVRNIIACAGSLPEAPPKTYIDVVRLDGLVDHISRYYREEFGDAKLQALRNFFERRVASGMES